MPRTLEVTLPPGLAEQLVDRAARLDHVAAVRLEKNISIHPSGDVVTIEVTNRGLVDVMRLLDDAGLAKGQITLKTVEPASLIHQPLARSILLDTSEASWEEMDHMIAKESNMTFSGLAIMAVAGFCSAVGLETDTLHLVIGGMLIAPGFEPLVRIPLGLLTGGHSWRYGLLHTATGYLTLFLGAVAGALMMGAMGVWPTKPQPTYLDSGELIRYWTQFSADSLAVSAVASVAGMILIITNRSLLTAGVMVALALVPTTAMCAVGLVGGEFRMAGTALARLLVEMVLVTGISAIVIAGKRYLTLSRLSSL